LGGDLYSHIQPAVGDVFLGGYNPHTGQSAVLDGRGLNASAFDGNATHVTIKYLVIEHFIPRADQYVVNHDAASYWTIEYDTIRQNGDTRGSQLGAALGMGSANIVEHDCLTHNGQYGLNAGGSGTEFNYNEIAWNGISYFPDTNCGCSGGIKYWDATNATIVGNYIHDNYSVGLWVDTDNAGFLIKNNYISDNWAEGIVYEISYNADITENTLVDNGWGVGSATAGGFPYGDAIYINGSGGDSNVASAFAGTFEITNNVLTDNWDGVVVYQNPNRLCGSTANSSNGYCTRGRQTPFSVASCTTNDVSGSPSERPDFWDGCQWKSQNITVAGNQFTFDPTAIATAVPPLPSEAVSHCPTVATSILRTGSNAAAPGSANQYWCGFNGMFSLPGSSSTGPASGWTVCDAIMNLTNPTGESADDNVWQGNTYTGPWAFQAYAQGHSPVIGDIFHAPMPTTVNFSEWQSIWHQDATSTTSPLPSG
jgi:parallel beta-helix repeat protein